VNEFENSEKDPEYIFNLPYHLAEGGMSDDLYEILNDFVFIEYKLSQKKEPQLLVDDYQQALQDSICISTERKYALELIQDAIRKSTNILQEYYAQLPGQLLGRLAPYKNSDLLAPLLKQINDWNEYPWLRPISVGLIVSGESLIRSINTRHDNMITAVAISDDGRFVVTAGSDGGLKLWDIETGILRKEMEMKGSWSITREGLKIFIYSDADLINDEYLKKNTLAKTLSISPDGQWLLVGSDTKHPQARSCPVELWKIEKNDIKSIDTFLIGHKDDITSLCLSEDAHFAVIGTFEGEVIIVDLKARRRKKEVEFEVKKENNEVNLKVKKEQEEDYLWYKKNGNNFCGVDIVSRSSPTNSIEKVTISPNSRWVVACIGRITTQDRTIKVWDLTNGCLHKVLSLKEVEKINTLNVSSEGEITILFENNTIKKHLMKFRNFSKYQVSVGMVMLEDNPFAVDKDWLEFRQFFAQIPYLKNKFNLDEDKQFIQTPKLWSLGKYVIEEVQNRLFKHKYSLLELQQVKLLNLSFGTKLNAITSDIQWGVSINNNNEIRLWNLSINSEITK
jgi:WD40 repeat protein